MLTKNNYNKKYFFSLLRNIEINEALIIAIYGYIYIYIYIYIYCYFYLVESFHPIQDLDEVFTYNHIWL